MMHCNFVERSSSCFLIQKIAEAQINSLFFWLVAGADLL
jgi:hypothetical protein